MVIVKIKLLFDAMDLIIHRFYLCYHSFRRILSFRESRYWIEHYLIEDTIIFLPPRLLDVRY